MGFLGKYVVQCSGWWRLVVVVVVGCETDHVDTLVVM